MTHELLGMATYDDHDGDAETLHGNTDLLLQGHIFSPKPVSEGPGAALIRGAICGGDLQKLLRRRPANGGTRDGD